MSWAGGFCSVAQCLPGNCEVLSLIPSTQINKQINKCVEFFISPVLCLSLLVMLHLRHIQMAKSWNLASTKHLHSKFKCKILTPQLRSLSFHFTCSTNNFSDSPMILRPRCFYFPWPSLSSPTFYLLILDQNWMANSYNSFENSRDSFALFSTMLIWKMSKPVELNYIPSLHLY